MDNSINGGKRGNPFPNNVCSVKEATPEPLPAEHCPKNHSPSTSCRLPIVHPDAFTSPGNRHTQPSTWYKEKEIIAPGDLLQLLQGPVLTLMCYTSLSSTHLSVLSSDSQFYTSPYAAGCNTHSFHNQY